MLLFHSTDVESPVFTIETTPSGFQLDSWWSCLVSNPQDIATAYADSFPANLVEFLDRINIGSYHHHQLICCGDDVAASFWLHDLMTKNGHVYGGWLGGYAMPAYRRFTSDIWAAANSYLLANGVQHVFAAVHQGNKRSRILLSQVLRFHRAGCYEQFTRFSGEPTSVVIYCMYEQDTTLAMVEADKRAIRNEQGNCTSQSRYRSTKAFVST